MKNTSFSSVTEVSGSKVTSEQMERMYVRYHFASEFCEDKEILEVACGSGQGLGYLAKKAKRVIGIDIDRNLLRIAEEYYDKRDKILLRLSDAHYLPFFDSSFDVVILYEAIYYLLYPEKFIKEAYRVLRKGGILIICTVNRDWLDFNPSPYSQKYFSVPELFDLLNRDGFVNIKLYGDCLVNNKTVKDKIISAVKRTAGFLHIIPKTMRGKIYLKRIFFGRLVTLPSEIYFGMSEYSPPVSIPCNCNSYKYKVLYVIGYK